MFNAAFPPGHTTGQMPKTLAPIKSPCGIFCALLRVRSRTPPISKSRLDISSLLFETGMCFFYDFRFKAIGMVNRDRFET